MIRIYCESPDAERVARMPGGRWRSWIILRDEAEG